MVSIHQIWRRITSTHYTRALETELTRQRAKIVLLRAENRALLNSILGIAGIPPIPIGLPGRPPSVPADEPGSSGTTFTPLSPAVGHSESPTHSSGGDESLSAPTSSSPQTAAQSDSSSRKSGTRNGSPLSPSSTGTRLAAPIRRRSWHQINRMLELESSRTNNSET